MANVKNAHRARKIVCPVCGRVEWVAGKLEGFTGVIETMKGNGWRLSRQVPVEPDGRWLICPKHFDGSGYKIYLDAEANRIEWDPKGPENPNGIHPIHT
jgi:hypothetical protein